MTFEQKKMLTIPVRLLRCACRDGSKSASTTSLRVCNTARTPPEKYATIALEAPTDDKSLKEIYKRV